MIKMTLYDQSGMRNGEMYIAKEHIIALNHGNPKGTIVTCTRGAFHVNQSVDQIISQMGK